MVAGAYGPPPGYDSAGVAKEVGRLRKKYRACFIDALTKHPDLGGRVTLVVRIGSDGKVLSVGGGGGGKIGPIVGCLKKETAAAQFPPPKAGSAVISIPITFVTQ